MGYWNTERDAMTLKSATDKPIFCVWDGGGDDTLDFSGLSQHQKINLNAESFSDLAGKGTANLLVTSKGEIKPGDVHGGGHNPDVQPVPKVLPALMPTPPVDSKTDTLTQLSEMVAKTLAVLLQLFQRLAKPS